MSPHRPVQACPDWQEQVAYRMHTASSVLDSRMQDAGISTADKMLPCNSITVCVSMYQTFKKFQKSLDTLSKF